MKVIKNFWVVFLSGLGFLIPFALIYAEVAGIVHSVKHHSTGDVIASIFIPPLAWYRSVEMYWHDDYANVDWNKQLESDMRTSISFFSEAANSEGNNFQMNKDIEQFSVIVNKYPVAKKQFLEEGCRKYVSYSNGLADDLVVSIKDYLSGGEFVFTPSPLTQLAASELSDTYKVKDQIEFLQEQMTELCNNINQQKANNYTQDETDKIIQGFESTIVLTRTHMENINKRVFKSIFNDEL